MNKRHSGISLCAIIALAMASTAVAHPGGITTPDPTLPPDGVYLSPFDVHATYGGGALTIVLSAVQHQPFAAQDPTYFQCDSTGVPGGTCEHHVFDSGLKAMVSINGGDAFPITMAGPVSTIAIGKGPTDTAGGWPTEMLSMSLQGVGDTPPSIMVRERDANSADPQPSLGFTSILEVGGPGSGPPYHIDSFFDVFTELSMDGGQTWLPSNGPTHVTLFVPEPASMVLLALGVLGFAGLARRR